MRYFDDAEERTPEIDDFRQTLAMQTALEGKLQWERALQILRETYAAGVCSSTEHRFLHSRWQVPTHVAEIVLDSPTDYPLFAWDLAMKRGTSDARKQVRAVGQVAKKEKWFA